MIERGKITYYNKKRRSGYIKTETNISIKFTINNLSNQNYQPEVGDIVEFERTSKNGKNYVKDVSLAIPKDFQNITYKIPKDTKMLVISDIFVKSVDNYYLKLNKLAPFDENHEVQSKSKFVLFKKDKRGNIFTVKPKFSDKTPLDIQAIVSRHKLNAQNLNMKIETLRTKTTWRMTVGLGNASIYETSITLHHIYGIPYIPGSAIKGVTRSCLISEKFNNKEEDALNDQGFCDIFGCPEKSFYGKARKGKVVFFDAFPLTFPRIEVDIMNPHYAPYYSNNSDTPPADYHDPRPIFFLTVRNTEFEFIIGAKSADNEEIQKGIFKDKKILDVAYQYMKKALREHGIGAKTAVGYGYMK